MLFRKIWQIHLQFFEVGISQCLAHTITHFIIDFGYIIIIVKQCVEIMRIYNSSITLHTDISRCNDAFFFGYANSKTFLVILKIGHSKNDNIFLYYLISIE